LPVGLGETGEEEIEYRVGIRSSTRLLLPAPPRPASGTFALNPAMTARPSIRAVLLLMAAAAVSHPLELDASTALGRYTGPSASLLLLRGGGKFGYKSGRRRGRKDTSEEKGVLNIDLDRLIAQMTGEKEEGAPVWFHSPNPISVDESMAHHLRNDPLNAN